MSHAVLLVDDEPNVVNALTRALRREAYEILTAHSAEEAARVLAERDVDVVVSDEEMPAMSGSEFLARVAREYPDVVRIMLTGHPTLPTALRAINEGGVTQFFTKPCNEIDLAVAIRRALERKDRDQEARDAREGTPRPATLVDQTRLRRRLREDGARPDAPRARESQAPGPSAPGD